MDRHTMKTYTLEDLDKAFYTWFVQKRNGGTPLSGPILKEKALWFHVQLCADENAITASDGWLTRWKQRHGVRQLAVQVEVLSSVHNNTEPFKEDLALLLQEHNIEPEQLSNADETGLYWKMQPNKTLAGGSETSDPGHKKMKGFVSHLACTGTHRLLILLIGK